MITRRIGKLLVLTFIAQLDSVIFEHGCNDPAQTDLGGTVFE